MNGINKKNPQHLFSQQCIPSELALSFFAGASILPMTTLTVCVTPLKIFHTHCVPKSFKPGIQDFFPPIFIRFILAFAGFLQNDITVFVVDLFVILSGVHHITGCVTLWICTALCSGNMGGWTSPTLLCPRGKSSNWSRRALSGKVGFLFDFFFSDLIIYFVMQINRSGKEICCF